MSLGVGGIESELPFVAGVIGAAVEDAGRCVRSDPAVPVVEVVPVDESVHPGPGVADAGGPDPRCLQGPAGGRHAGSGSTGVGHPRRCLRPGGARHRPRPDQIMLDCYVGFLGAALRLMAIRCHGRVVVCPGGTKGPDSRRSGTSLLNVHSQDIVAVSIA